MDADSVDPAAASDEVIDLIATEVLRRLHELRPAPGTLPMSRE